MWASSPLKFTLLSFQHRSGWNIHLTYNTFHSLRSGASFASLLCSEMKILTLLHMTHYQVEISEKEGIRQSTPGWWTSRPRWSTRGCLHYFGPFHIAAHATMMLLHHPPKLALTLVLLAISTSTKHSRQSMITPQLLNLPRWKPTSTRDWRRLQGSQPFCQLDVLTRHAMGVCAVVQLQAHL